MNDIISVDPIVENVLHLSTYVFCTLVPYVRDLYLPNDFKALQF